MGPIKGLWRWLDERTNVSGVTDYLLKHPVPAALTTRIGWFYVFGFGLLVVFALQVLTGIGLATMYVPSPADAHSSVAFITEEATLGYLIRGMHYIGASAMVILVLFHTTRIFLMGSHKFPRELNWMTGVILLGLIFVMLFTGQLLRWDVNSIAGVHVATEQVGRVPIIGGELARFILAGEAIGGATLTRFYVAHVIVVPILIGLVIAVHMYLVLHTGVSEPPKAGEEVKPKEYKQRYQEILKRGRPYFPDMMWREVVFATGVVAAIFVFALVLGPRTLGEPPDPTLTEVEPRPDWYLLWLFALFSILGPRIIEDSVLVLGPILLLIALLLIPIIGNSGERSPMVRPLAVLGVAGVFIVLGGLTYAGWRAPWEPRFDTRLIDVQARGIDDAMAIEGARIFLEKGCQYCHAILDEGGIRGRDLTDVVPRLGEGAVVARILAPPAGMPSYADNITPDEMERLMAFLQAVAELE